MNHMPSVFDFGFKTSHYSIPHHTLGDFNGYTQPHSPYNNAPTAKTMFSDRSGREQELNVTVNMTNVLDGKELANGSYAYTTKLQDREQKKESGILRVVNKLGKLGFTFNKIRKDYIQMLVGRKRPSWAPVKRSKEITSSRRGSFSSYRNGGTSY